ncbi:Vps21p [Histomonas meleagridis]|uniref:Vps21p n=1 Tax=Histomonas meleagridis TaxID=135588 RepID=UPI00355981A5|nr:Vps21p [Histomonas meleagridis]KAH0806040.1 Vps21p [Histomonas meleagridis]
MEYSPAFRIVLIGDAFVGKTALAKRFIFKDFQINYEETVGAAFHSFTEKIDKNVITYQLWDTAGTEKYRSLAPVYFRNASAAIIVYDVTSLQTFHDLDDWIETFKKIVEEDALIFIVGNKIDLVNETKVSTEDGQKFAEERGYSFFSTSAVTGENVIRLFSAVAEAIYEKFGTKNGGPQQLMKEETKCC